MDLMVDRAAIHGITEINVLAERLSQGAIR